MKNFLLRIFNPEYLAETTTNPVVLDKLSKNKNSYVRWCVANNPNTTPETLEYLSRDEYSYVRHCVAYNPNTTPETLDVLSRDEYAYVRRGVAKNPNCSERAYKYIKGLELLKSLSEVST